MQRELIKQMVDESWAVDADTNEVYFDYYEFADLILKQVIEICEQGSDTQTTSSGVISRICSEFGLDVEK
jgi:hypothetical protein